MTAFHCRDCGRLEAHLSRKRGVFENAILPLLLLRPVRCADCYRRQYVTIFCELPRRPQHHPEQPQPPGRLAA